MQLPNLLFVLWPDGTQSAIEHVPAVVSCIWFVLVALLVARFAGRWRLRVFAASCANWMVAVGLIVSLAQIVRFYDLFLNSYRLSDGPWPDIPFDSISGHVGREMQAWPWLAMCWSLLLAPLTVRAWCVQALGTESFGRSSRDLFVWLAPCAAALLSFEWVVGNFFNGFSSGVPAPDVYWHAVEYAAKQGEIFRCVLEFVIVLAALAFWVRAARNFRFKPSKASMALGATVLLVGAWAYLSTRAMRSDTVDYFRHDNSGPSAHHRHEPRLSVVPLYGQDEELTLDRCEVRKGSANVSAALDWSCAVGPRSYTRAQIERDLGRHRDLRHCAHGEGVYLLATPDADIEEMRGAMAHAAAQGVARFHLMSTRFVAVERATTQRVAHAQYCTRVFEVVPGADKLDEELSWREFTAKVDARAAPTRVSLSANDLLVWGDGDLPAG